ncbi:hypothetical protein J41TS12_17390 [Paenibacillus antibioticophila]|uniref:Uncharacterized protein n=1 Tax=Paenibacillus antibioticophila TaxID=1274374 RepID=A0A919XSR1_9BACL|nr:hypothetical protein [Paenibacillus antibioticophila]GIO36878.1 hypothetical protein J41TS12_17390 [Paenibacillus antibioticophila]
MIQKIKLGSKSYSVTGIPASVSREAMKINRDALELAKMEEEIQQVSQDGDYDKLAEIMDKLIEIKDRKAALICKVYGDKFDLDMLLDNASDADIDQQINMITSRIGNMIAKK